MCKFCDVEDPEYIPMFCARAHGEQLFDEAHYLDLAIYIQDGVLGVDCMASIGELYPEFKIAFCPFCGQKLEKPNG